jgi:4-hydroxybenzoate polyprenyltransferase
MQSTTVSSSPSAAASDIAVDNWVDRLAPALVRPYLRLARLDRPIGTWLLLLPCWWGLALATPGWPDWRLGLLFAVGALVMRAAGCTVNATRPIASGAVSAAAGVAFFVLLALSGLWVLVQFNDFAVKLGVSSLALVVIYPFMKRITYWPQLWLGLTFNWGALMGYAVVSGGLGWAPGWLYAAGILWTLGYDTIYAHQDKEDDLLVGVKSSALALGDDTKPWLALFYAGALALIVAAGWSADLAWPFYAGLAVAAAHAVWQVRDVDIDGPKDCLAKFKSNRDFGLIVLAAIVAGQVWG